MPAKRQRAPTSKQAFSVEFPHALDARRDGDAWWFEIDGRELRLSNLDKVFWPDEGYTKGDLVAYYLNVAELIVPHLAERPLTMKRMPDGILGPFFYEKSAPSHVPDWIGRCKVLSEDSKVGVIDYMTIEDTAGLLYITNLGCIEFHPLHSRCEDVEHPDYLFFDLDPFPPYTYEDVLTVARHIKALLDQLGLAAYPKTSGATGMQIYMPLEQGRYAYEIVRAFVGACGRLIAHADRERVTMAWKIADRAGKVFIDHNMNRSGANISATYSLRPEPRAPVSTPLTWDEVSEGGFEPRDFRIDNVWERFERVGDLFDGVKTKAMDLTNAFEALGVDLDEQDDPPSRRTRTSEEVIAASKDPKLAEYTRKRDFEGTPEPAPGSAQGGEGNSFVIHKHRATRLHYDVRLEFHFVKTRTDWLAFLASAQDSPLIDTPPRFQPMLAEGGWKAFDDAAWWFEPKLDGIRSMTYMTTGETHLFTRTGRDVTSQYP